MKPQHKPPSTALPSPRLQSRAVVVLTGLAYLFVGLGFAYLDRHFLSFGFESLLWCTWAALGFGMGALQVHKPNPVGQTLAWVMGTVGMALVLFPGFAMFALARWICLALMVTMGARAAMLRTQRDFYLTLTVVFAVSFMVATHSRADWSLWFYLGPAWVLGGLALAWQHASGTALSRWIRLGMTLGFIGMALGLAALLFLFAPRPPVLGFGFIPPAADTPGLFGQPAADPVAQLGFGTASKPGVGAGSGSGSGGGAGGAGGGSAQQWQTMLDRMRSALDDPSIPAWQHRVIAGLLGGVQALVDALAGGGGGGGGEGDGEGDGYASSSYSLSFTISWLWWLLGLLAAYLLWRRRYRIGLWWALGLAWCAAGRFPQASMRLSARAMGWCLRVHGFPQAPGQSVREHWSQAAIAPLARRWTTDALEIYGATRFGGVPATPQRARTLHQALRAACDILLGEAPELRH